MSPEINPKSFGTFEKQAPGVELSEKKKRVLSSKKPPRSHDVNNPSTATIDLHASPLMSSIAYPMHTVQENEFLVSKETVVLRR